VYSQLYLRVPRRYVLLLHIVSNINQTLINAINPSQPMLSLLFGNLTQDFVNFQIIVASAGTGNATAQAGISAAASHFRSTAAKDASYLVYIGQSSSN
jgi:ATP-binding cassette, subfamily B (MDR/TAP), member 1